MHQHEHIVDIYRLSEELNIPERKIIDFSTSVSPLGISRKVKAEIRRQLKYLHRYPDPDAKWLRRRLGQYHGIDPGTILCSNGSTELIHLIARAFNPRKVLILIPTFSEYERACRISDGTEVIRYGLKREDNFALDPDSFIQAIEGKLPNPFPIPFASGSPSPRQPARGPHLYEPEKGGLQEIYGSPRPFEMAFLCNPNNPTGIRLDKKAIERIADAAKNLGCYLVIDEAYIDFSPGGSVIGEVTHNPFLFVLRSMSHYYALAGVRLGYGAFPVHCVERLKAYKAPWMVNSLAQRAAAAALKDKTFRKDSLEVMQRERAFLEKSFRKLGITFFPSDANFYLVTDERAPHICRRLRSKGILVRDCSDFPGLDNSYIRIAVKSHRENTALIRELLIILEQGE